MYEKTLDLNGKLRPKSLDTEITWLHIYYKHATSEQRDYVLQGLKSNGTKHLKILHTVRDSKVLACIFQCFYPEICNALVVHETSTRTAVFGLAGQVHA